MTLPETVDPRSMFRCLKRFLLRRRLNKRGLFRFHDGQRWRYADPFLLWRKLQIHDKLNLETMGPEVDVGGEPETTIVIEALCEIFGITRFSDATGEGVTDWEVLDILGDLEAYFDALKKNSNPGLTSPEPTEQTSSDSPADPIATGS